MGDYYTPFSLRIPEELLERIKARAKKNCRSANKEIEYMLTQYLDMIHDGTEQSGSQE